MKGKKIRFDARWKGDHGIGRFSSEMLKRIENFEQISSCLITDFGRGVGGCFSPGYRPLLLSSKFIFTIHDLNHIDVEYNSSALKRLYYETVIKLGISRAFRVVTVTEFSKSRIVQWSGCDPDKIVVVGNGVSEVFLLNTYGVINKRPYFFTVSNRKGHKNENRLIVAFKDSGLADKFDLVLTGSASDELNDLLDDLDLTESVRFTGRLTEHELAQWYRGAFAFVFVSLYEGFGLPVVEAMASRVPVIASNVASLPEVGGEAALYVDPYDVGDIANAMNLMVSDDKLREALVDKGIERAGLFSWDKTANILSDVILEMINS